MTIEVHERIWNRYLSTDVDAISETVEITSKALSLDQPINLRHLISILVNAEHLAAVLRVTSSRKDLVPGWDEALEVCKGACLCANIDPNDALYGMI